MYLQVMLKNNYLNFKHYLRGYCKKPSQLLTALGMTLRTVASVLPLSSNLVTVMSCNIYSETATVPNASGISANVQLG